jgi:hypothetical protein
LAGVHINARVENVVRDPETNEIGLNEPEKLSFFDSESKFYL